MKQIKNIAKEEEYVVLVDEKNKVLGRSPKLATHNAHTPLHRGFSVFLFNNEKELLLQQRSKSKKTWPLVWSNSCCGHPMENETPIDAAKRRLAYELGIYDAELTIVLPDYRYRCEKDGIVENEICPVMVGFVNHEPVPNPLEVEDYKWMKWDKWVHEVKKNPKEYSQWCVEETLLLENSELLK